MRCTSRNVPNITGEYYSENWWFAILWDSGFHDSWHPTVPFMVNTCSEALIDGNWLPKEMDGCIRKFNKHGFKVRALVVDNDSSNVNALPNILSSYNGEQIFIHHPGCGNQLKIYIFYNRVHTIKNVRDNICNSKKFIFPAFTFHRQIDKILVPTGYKQWSYFHRLH